MEFNDLKLGTIIEQNDSYSVVLGISDFPDYEKRFAVKDAYNYIPIVVYRLVSFTLQENLSDKENALNAKRQVINNLLTVTMQEEIKADLMYIVYVVQVIKFDMKPRTKEIQTWLMKNKLFHPSVCAGILDVEDRKKRLKEIIAKRDNYHFVLYNKNNYLLRPYRYRKNLLIHIPLQILTFQSFSLNSYLYYHNMIISSIRTYNNSLSLL